MKFAVCLDKKETDKVGDKKGIFYKAIVSLLKELKDKTGLEIMVIGRDKNDKLFELDIHKK